jgi:hypothetical protein
MYDYNNGEERRRKRFQKAGKGNTFERKANGTSMASLAPV